MSKDEKKHPIQPLVYVDGVLRFKENEIVSRLLNEGGIDLNQIAVWEVSKEDREQFAQLIGYSHSGFGDLGYASNEVYETSYKMYEEDKSELEARVEYLQDLVSSVRSKIRDGIADLFCKHPDDLECDGDD